MTIKDLDEIIAEHEFFASMPAVYRKIVAGCGRNTVFRAGEFLFRTGEQADQFFLVRSGRVSLELQAPGQDVFRFETLAEGAVAGWSWVVPPHLWQFDARAIEDTRVISFDGVCLRGKCDDDPKLGYDMMKRFSQVLARRYADTRLQLLDVYGQQRG